MWASTSETAEHLREMARKFESELLAGKHEYIEAMNEAANEIDKQRDIAEANRQEAASLRKECSGNRKRTARAVAVLQSRDDLDGWPGIVESAIAILTETETEEE